MAADAYIDIDGIKGESNDKTHKEMIEVLSFSWGASNGASFSHGTGGGAGKVSFTDLSIMSMASKASPLLMLACATGSHQKKAMLYVRKAGGEQLDFYTVELTDVLVATYQTSGSSGGEIPSESFSLAFAKINFEYKPQDEKGGLASPIKAGWDVKANVKC